MDAKCLCFEMDLHRLGCEDISFVWWSLSNFVCKSIYQVNWFTETLAIVCCSFSISLFVLLANSWTISLSLSLFLSLTHAYVRFSLFLLHKIHSQMKREKFIWEIECNWARNIAKVREKKKINVNTRGRASKWAKRGRKWVKAICEWAWKRWRKSLIISSFEQWALRT